MVTITVLPAATPAAGTVTGIVVPVVVLAFVPMFLTSEIAAAASDAKSATSSGRASIAHRRRAAVNFAEAREPAAGLLVSSFTFTPLVFSWAPGGPHRGHRRSGAGARGMPPARSN